MASPEVAQSLTSETPKKNNVFVWPLPLFTALLVDFLFGVLGTLFVRNLCSAFPVSKERKKLSFWSVFPMRSDRAWGLLRQRKLRGLPAVLLMQGLILTWSSSSRAFSDN